MKILCLGDLHLGQTASRLPPALKERRHELSAAGAFQRVVKAACEQQIDVLTFSGDLVECERDYFEAHRLLEQGIERLSSQGTRILGICGNHDVYVLPALADELPAFELLGRGGTWQKSIISSQGETVEFHGYSFAQAQEHQSPLTKLSLPAGEPHLYPRIGLLHCDRDQAQSPYAPVTSKELHSAGMDLFLLGHIHKPDALSLSNPIGYLGSVAGLDPSESGDHGPTFIQIKNNHITSIEQWTLSPMRYQPLTLDITNIKSPMELRSHLLRAIKALDQTLCQKPLWQRPLACGIRLVLEGSSERPEMFEQWITTEDQEMLYHSSIHYFIESQKNHTEPTIPLEQLASRPTPLGLLAQRLLTLKADIHAPLTRRLIDSYRQTLKDQYADRLSPRTKNLLDGPASDELLRSKLITSAQEALRHMIHQSQAADKTSANGEAACN